jgi:hypothetical protein
VPRHWIQVYEHQDDRDQLSAEYSEKIRTRGINNFVLVLFHFDYTGSRQFGFYFAQQRETLEFYQNLVRSVSPERFEEIAEYCEDFSDDDTLNEFADAAIDMIEVPADEMDIGYPEKITGYLERNYWSIEKIQRFGTFATDVRLSDAEIINELCGYSGGSHTWYFATCQLSNKAHIQEINDNYGFCLYHNDVWRRAIRDYLEYLDTKSQFCTILLSIFNPENILETIALFCKYADTGYIPNFRLVIEDPVAHEYELFEGELVTSGDAPADISAIMSNTLNLDFASG